ncbi:hypothetical protein Clacol_001882 [Clathrus columnatus]|uniref:Protein transport protein SEC22 n=1 Tax=Clathrus columnatus TaxID=1419009 RepID=A0AAV5A2L2_9AGAM|nr:hypothetical protein Clacol_001882 [Clathrus columnatus]
MVRSTTIVRASDALPLAASVDDDQTEQTLQEYKQQSKLIFRRITPNSEPRCSIESGPYILHYLISDNVVYLTIAEKSYPRKLAFSYLDELSKEFAQSYGAKVDSVRKPYAFVGFDTFMSKTARLYQDTRTADAAESGLDKLNGELQDVTRIMTKNMEELLWRGDSLDRMSHLSTSLRSESEKYRKASQKLNFDAMMRQYAPLAAVFLIVSNKNGKTFDNDELGLPKAPTWSVHELLNSYPPIELSDETLTRLHTTAALFPPEKDSSEFKELKNQMEDLIRLVEAVRVAPLPFTDSPDVQKPHLDGRIWPEERGLNLHEFNNKVEEQDNTCPPEGRKLLERASRHTNGFYLVDSSQVKKN